MRAGAGCTSSRSAPSSMHTSAATPSTRISSSPIPPAVADVGIGCPAPIFPVRDLDAAQAFYARLGFRVWKHDEGYGYAQREGLKIHLRWEDVDPHAGGGSVYVETSEADRLHVE